MTEVRTGSVGKREPEVESPAIDTAVEELLDHLVSELALEYVRLMEKTGDEERRERNGRDNREGR